MRALAERGRALGLSPQIVRRDGRRKCQGNARGGGLQGRFHSDLAKHGKRLKTRCFLKINLIFRARLQRNGFIAAGRCRKDPGLPEGVAQGSNRLLDPQVGFRLRFRRGQVPSIKPDAQKSGWKESRPSDSDLGEAAINGGFNLPNNRRKDLASPVRQRIARGGPRKENLPMLGAGDFPLNQKNKSGGVPNALRQWGPNGQNSDGGKRIFFFHEIALWLPYSGNGEGHERNLQHSRRVF